VNILEFSLIFEPSEARTNATMIAIFSDRMQKVPPVKFDWNELPRLFEIGARHGLEQMTFDEHPYQLNSIQIDYEKKRVTINVGDPLP
jgi:hypothetical protein